MIDIQVDLLCQKLDRRLRKEIRVSEGWSSSQRRWQIQDPGGRITLDSGGGGTFHHNGNDGYRCICLGGRSEGQKDEFAPNSFCEVESNISGESLWGKGGRRMW